MTARSSLLASLLAALLAGAAAECVSDVAGAWVPAGFCVREWAGGGSGDARVYHPRTPLQQADTLLVASGGFVAVMWDDDGDGRSGVNERARLVTHSGLNHGLAVHDGFLYASSVTTVWRWPYTAGQREPITAAAQVVVQGMPTGGHHTRSLVVDGDGNLFVQVGSGSNVDQDSHRARVMRYDAAAVADGNLLWTNGTVWADGERNAVGLALDRQGVLWSVGHQGDRVSRESLGGDIHNGNPGEEMNRYDVPGRFYGYPYCFTEGDLPDGVGGGRGTQWAWPTFASGVHNDVWCKNSSNNHPPLLTFTAHSGPDGLAFYHAPANDSQLALPADYEGDAFVAFHGSWNRNPPSGYAVVRVRMSPDGLPLSYQPFLRAATATGDDVDARWSSGVRPAGVTVGQHGELFVTSDASNQVFIVRPTLSRAERDSAADGGSSGADSGGSSDGDSSATGEDGDGSSGADGDSDGGTAAPPDYSRRLPCSAPLSGGAAPAGVCVQQWASGIRFARDIRIVPGGMLAATSNGRVYMLWDDDDDGRSDESERVLLLHVAGLNHAVIPHGGFLYASSTTAVYRWPYRLGQRTAITAAAELVVSDIPSGGHHTRSLEFDAAGRLYVASGSGSNMDATPDRAGIRRYALTADSRLPLAWDEGDWFAKGLRNSVGLAWDELDDTLWSTNHGSDQLARADLGGDLHNDNPGEEVNRFSQAGRFYGYPYCFTEFNLGDHGAGRGAQWAYPSGPHDDAWCKDSSNNQPPAWAMQAHAAPDGMAHYWASPQLPYAFSAFRGDTFVTQHGSWNRDIPAGYQIVRLSRDRHGAVTGEQPFFKAAGEEDKPADWHLRPVSVRVGAAGELFFSCDSTHAIYVARNLSDSRLYHGTLPKTGGKTLPPQPLSPLSTPAGMALFIIAFLVVLLALAFFARKVMKRVKRRGGLAGAAARADGDDGLELHSVGVQVLGSDEEFDDGEEDDDDDDEDDDDEYDDDDDEDDDDDDDDGGDDNDYS